MRTVVWRLLAALAPCFPAAAHGVGGAALQSAPAAALADSAYVTWEQSVASQIKTFVSRHRIATPGAHVVTFWMVDGGVVLQKLVLSTGELPNSYLGPPESAYRAPGAQAVAR